jgi:hypothetical protein
MSDFTTEGFESFPNIYVDNLQTHEFSTWNRAVLEARVMQYGTFLQQSDLMPRAKEGANRVMDHLLFELAWRDGVYDNQERVEDAEVL